MGAVVGIYRLDQQAVDRTHMERMISGVAHRGRDGVGPWVEGPVGVGQRTLRTTREAARDSPSSLNQSGHLVLAADARIDNRDELLSALLVTRRRADELTDGELILAAYETWGERCVERLTGDFAFALWDGRRQVLFCARDHFGVKPFYYYHSDRVFVFASEIKALLCLAEVPRRLDEARVGDYLSELCDDKASTFYRDVRRLRPGHSLCVSREGVRERAYWSLAPARELRLGSDEAYVEAFREVFDEAVRCRLRGADAVGSTLSGGLDSSSITCTARGLLARDAGRRLHTFSAVFDEVPECDERAFIGAVLAQGGVESHFVRADRLSPLDDCQRVLWEEDEPFYAPNLYLHRGLYGAASEQRVGVLLDGIDGDTVVSHGLAYLAELARAGRWVRLGREVRAFAGNYDRPARRTFWGYAWRGGVRARVPESLRRVWRRLRPRATPSPLPQMINPEFARRIDLRGRLDAARGGGSRPARTAREIHHRQLTHGLHPFMFEVADRAAAPFSVEPRYPFFDRRLAEFCLALPPEQKFSGGWPRLILRRAMQGVLPRSIQWRRGKTNLGPNFHRGLLNSDRELVEDLILRAPGRLGEYINLRALREAYRRYVAGVRPEPELSIWTAVTLGLWLRRSYV